ncbi:hypothetical protein DCCM_2065 [Desulfocucumis palustris]|uniref:Uncharacterized protein n=1 Tax=Desulfocucumis palustris TaxID=1898651 RepID=A0A2L2X9Z5_9FIRM|nr:hypothetical protein [Desulfocucumis palustris]GBF32968.1 hypothetical protein DCCM_2065 [Desulfocucumis palustris]
MDKAVSNYPRIKCVNTIYAVKKSRLDTFYEMLHIKKAREEAIFSKGKVYPYRRGIHGLFILGDDDRWWFVNDNSLVNNFLLDYNNA